MEAPLRSLMFLPQNEMKYRLIHQYEIKVVPTSRPSGAILISTTDRRGSESNTRQFVGVFGWASFAARFVRRFGAVRVGFSKFLGEL